MKHYLVILSMILYLAGSNLVHAAQGFCPAEGSAVPVLLAEDNGDKKDGEAENPEDDCE